ncbi:exo-alpha-sialidase [Massilia sp. RP-1-19]|uniref:Exo-alpha-sialidase n=1 Tax=Massilia polaris TaxID=2728846 RepID=A0A848HP29_9BURK|nr:sialidase family protein [Massilia polaris]NML62924.1 exo-alpha-sialidase [Massilia polaris]
MSPSPHPHHTNHGAIRRSRLLAFACVAIVLAALGAEIMRWSRDASPAKSPALLELIQLPGVKLTERSSSLIPMPPNVPSAHASAMAPLSDGRMIAFWWAGSRESGPDVKVYASRWAEGKWGQPWEVASRDSLGSALGFGVRRIGNPVAWTAADGKINLFVVATGLGGWAAARVVQLVSSDSGDSFTVKRLLPMSPLFNTSVLVRTAPVRLANGAWGLPLYFELGIKYPMMLAFDAHGDPNWLSRIGTRMTALQPTIVPVSDSEVHAWMRDSSDEQRVQYALSRDGGVSWADMPSLDLPNHSTSLSALRLSNGSIVVLHNHVLPGGSARNMLRLSIAKDARTWTQAIDVAHGKAGEEFSYPDLRQIGNQLHITYTSRREAIAHHIIDLEFGGIL